MQSNAARAALAVFLVAVAVVLFVVLKDDGSSDSDEATSTAQATETTTAPAEPAVERIEVSGGAPAGGVAELAADKGDRVRFEVASDQAGDVHVHGYDIERPVEAGGETTVSFTANLDGVYEIEVHFPSGEPHEAQIGELTVSPD
jgi:hypothetical protein